METLFETQITSEISNVNPKVDYFISERRKCRILGIKVVRKPESEYIRDEFLLKAF